MGRGKNLIILVQSLSLTLCYPMDCSLPGSPVHGISHARILEWVAISFSRGSSPPRDQTHVSWIAGGFFISYQPVFHPWVRKIPWRRNWQPTPVLLPGKFHGQRSLVGYSPWGCKELDTTEWLHFLYHWATREAPCRINLESWLFSEIMYSQFSLFMVLMVYRVTMNTRLANTELSLGEEIQS